MAIVEIDAVVGIWEDMDIIVVNTCQIQFVEQVKRILQVHVVVRYTVHHQKPNIILECCHVGDSGVVVARRVVVGCVHVAFCIDGVWEYSLVKPHPFNIHKSFETLTIESPVRNRRHGHSVLECFASVLLNCLQGHKPTVTPSPDSKSTFIDILFLCPDFGCFNLVACFIVSQVPTNSTSSFPADGSRSSTVNGDHDIAQVRGNIGLEINGELAVNGLRVGAVVQMEEHGILLSRVEVWRTTFDNLECEAVNSDVLENLSWECMLFDLAGQIGIFFDDVFQHEPLALVVRDGLPWHRRAFVTKQGKSTAVREGCLKISWF